MEQPQELSLAEIRKYMLENNCKVTNHALVKHFKPFLTKSETQHEARKEFKTYVNILATIKNENNQKYLILRKKYLHECPTDEAVQRAVNAASYESAPSSPGSFISDSGMASPFRQPPPYIPPPDVNASGLPKPPPIIMAGGTVQQANVESYRDCVNEFEAAVRRMDPARLARQTSNEAEKKEEATVAVEMRNKTISRQNSNEDAFSNKENIPRFSFSSGNSGMSVDSEKVSSSEGDVADNPISVKEATRKFNRMASEEEAKIISPPSKKKADKQLLEEKNEPEVTLAHPKAKEWIVSMAKANYQELAKLAIEFPELVKLQDPATSYTALHWAAKHGNEDVVKLIAGTHKADVNARSNGGYTPLHLAMQFDRVNIFELLCNVYKANRDIMDWSGNKPLDYSKQRTTVSASTYSSEYSDMFLITTDDFNNNNDNNNNNHTTNTQHGRHRLRLLAGSGGETLSSALSRGKKRSQMRYATISTASGGGASALSRTQSLLSAAAPLRRHKQSKPVEAFKYTDDESLIPCDILTSGDASLAASSDNANTNEMPATSTSSLHHHGVADDAKKKSNNSAQKTSRKESFLRKTLRAAAASKHNSDFVTNQAFME